jgi:hypothetical protein
MSSICCRKLLPVALWATASFALTLAFMRPQRLDAVPPPAPDGILINAPKLAVEGAELSLLYDDRPAPTEQITLDAGSKLPISLLARSTTADGSTAVQVKVSIFVRTPASRESRVLPASQEVWSSEQTITLSPGQPEQKIALKPSVPLPAGTSVFVTLTCGQQSVRTLNVSVGPDTTLSKGS